MKLSKNIIVQFYNTLRIYLLLILSLSLFYACQPNIINLQKIDLRAPSIKNPVKIVEKVDTARLDLNFNFSMNNNNKYQTNLKGHTKVNEKNIYELEPVVGEEHFLEHKNVNIYDFKGKNLTWKIPSLIGSINLDFKSSKLFVVTLGAEYSKYRTKEFYGFNLGLALYHNLENLGLRFDAFVKNQEVFYNLQYIKAEKYDNNVRKVFVIKQRKKDNNYNMGYMLSMNTKFPEWFLNIFASYSFGWRTLYDISPARVFAIKDIVSGKFKLSSYYSSFSVGLYQNDLSFGKVILGYNITNFNIGDKNLLLPGLIFQVDFNLFNK